MWDSKHNVFLSGLELTVYFTMPRYEVMYGRDFNVCVESEGVIAEGVSIPVYLTITVNGKNKTNKGAHSY